MEVMTQNKTGARRAHSTHQLFFERRLIMNKRILCIISIVMTLCVNSMAIDFMGPPSASLDSGQWKIGYTYHYSKNDLLVKDIKLNGTDTGIDEEDIDGMKVERHYFTFNYGIEPRRWEVYGFLGIANMKENESWSLFGEDVRFDAKNDFAFGIGTKITTNSSEDVDWGILVQASWLKAEDKLWSGTFDYDGDTYSGKWDEEVDAWEIQVAVGPTFKNDGWKVYGGPFFHMIGGDTESKLTGSVNEVPGEAKISGDLQQDNWFGGYIGVQIDLWKNVDIGVEYAYTGSCEGIGGNVSWKF